MTSAALGVWRSERAARLDELFEAHRRVGGPGAGRRTETEQINWALVLRLAGEFQGFARDLHFQGTGVFAASLAAANPAAASTVRTLVTLNLNLDRGNAEPGSLGDAFNRFGLSWWPALEARDARTTARQRHLARLNQARNAIAHARYSELEALRQVGFPMTLDTVRTWRSALSGLATTMDGVLSAHLSSLFGAPRPW